MPDIVPVNPLDIQNELTNLGIYKYQPNGIVNVTLNRLKDMLGGKVDIVDPSNPFIYLLETNCLNTAFAVQEYTLIAKKLYPKLANSPDELYLHMSDYDYKDMFSKPAFGEATFNILLNDITSKAYYDPIDKIYTLKIPRHLKISINKYVFTLTSGVIIRKAENGVIDVKFEDQTYNNLFPLNTTHINYNLFKVNQSEQYLNFTLKVPEIDIEATEIPIEKSRLFRNTINYNPNRKFYFFQAFYRVNNEWKEMSVSYTDEVYDINKPTCIVKVDSVNHRLSYYIPAVYINNNIVTSKVKFLIYTTNGYIDIDFNDYKLADFNVEYNPVFPEIDTDQYSKPLYLINKAIYLRDRVIDGNDGLSFDEMKSIVINNSLYKNLPITNKQIELYATENNFNLIYNTDVVTNRIFLLEANIPRSVTKYPIAKINLDLIEYKSTFNNLLTGYNSIIVIDDKNIIIPEGTLFRLYNNLSELITEYEQNIINNISDTALTEKINSDIYSSVMYHYILSIENDIIDLRPYDINTPVIEYINFKEFNPSGQVGINTVNSSIIKTPTGYTINILPNINKYNNNISQTNITPYIVKTVNNSKFFLKGSVHTSTNNVTVYTFNLETNFYIDKDNKINVNNFVDANNIPTAVNIDLNTDLDLIYTSNYTPPTYTQSTLDDYIYGTFIANGNIVITLESMNVTLGKYLEYLYRRVHTSAGDSLYQEYQDDVPLKYTSNVYDNNNNIIHYKNDIVYDKDNKIVYQHHKGDILLDENNKPKLLSVLDQYLYLNLLVMDYKTYLANKEDIIQYRTYVRNYLTELITDNAKNMQEVLLENTVGYVTVPKTLSNVLVKTPLVNTSISSYQTFTINVYVTESVYNNTDVRNNISYIIIESLDDYLYQNKNLSRTIFTTNLYNKLKENIVDVSVPVFTDINSDYLQVLDQEHSISLAKILVKEPDGYNVMENVNINFIKI